MITKSIENQGNIEDDEFQARTKVQKTHELIGTIKKSKSNELVIFLGAGVSMPFGIPGMRQFMELLDNAVKSGEISVEDGEKKLWDTLLAIPEEENVKKDLEWILSILNDLSERNLRSIIKLFAPPPNENQLEQLRSSAKKLKVEVEKYVRGKCRLPKDKRNIAIDYCRGFFEELLNGWGHHPKIFTTNYDDMIESSNERRNSDIGPERPKISLVNGFSSSSESQYRIWDPKVFEDRIIGNSIPHHLFKLHGSIDWYVGQRDNQQVILHIGAVGSGLELTDGTKLESLLIYPVEEKRVFSPPFTELFYQFRSTLIYEARILVVIGYSFRDEIIQNLFKEALERNKGLRILIVNNNMDQIRRTLCDFGDRVTTIEEGFGSGEFIPSLLKKLWEETGKTIVYQAEHLPKRNLAKIVEDSEAMNGIAVELSGNGVIYGPYRPLPEKGKYKITYRIKIIPGSSEYMEFIHNNLATKIARIDISPPSEVRENYKGKKYIEDYLTASNFMTRDGHIDWDYLDFPFEFEYDGEPLMEYRIESGENASIGIDRISIEKIT